MKKLTVLLAVVMFTCNLVGCGCTRRLRDWWHQGTYIGPTAAVAPVMASPYAQPTYVAPPVASGCQPCCPPPPCCDPCGCYGTTTTPYDAGCAGDYTGDYDAADPGLPQVIPGPGTE